MQRGATCTLIQNQKADLLLSVPFLQVVVETCDDFSQSKKSFTLVGGRYSKHGKRISNSCLGGGKPPPCLETPRHCHRPHAHVRNMSVDPETRSFNYISFSFFRKEGHGPVNDGISTIIS